MRTGFSFLLAVASLVCFNAAASGEDEPGVQKSAQLDTQVGVKMGYLLYLPKDYDKQESWPLMLFLHGAGERGDDLELVKKHGPPKLVAAGKEMPFIVVSPQCPKGKWWEPIELTALLDEIIKKYKVDEERIYVTGLSMGGFGTWRLAAYTPQRFAAIAPICGGGETYWVQMFPHLPTWVFHGAKDTAVPLERSTAMVDALKKIDGNVKLTVYPEAGHDSWTETYDNPEFYKWLLEQKRDPKFGSYSKSELEATVGRGDSRIRFSSNDDGLICDLSSGFGIDKAMIKRLGDDWPKAIVVRLHLSGLESFKAANEDITVEWSVSSTGNNASRVVLHKGQEEIMLDAKSPYYTQARIVGGNGTIPLKDGYFEVPLPAKLFEKNPPEIKLQWIDFFRN